MNQDRYDNMQNGLAILIEDSKALAKSRTMLDEVRIDGRQLDAGAGAMFPLVANQAAAAGLASADGALAEEYARERADGLDLELFVGKPAPPPAPGFARWRAGELLQSGHRLEARRPVVALLRLGR